MLFLIKLVQFSKKKKKLNETTLKGLSCATGRAATSLAIKTIYMEAAIWTSLLPTHVKDSRIFFSLIIRL